MDYLRSCYSTMMVLSQDGHQAKVDWYFADANAPRLGTRHRMHSLNYVRPSIPLGPIGEVETAGRQWRNGTRPPYIGVSTPGYSTVGTPDWWLNGEPAPEGAIGVNYLGQKGFPYAERRGLFPPISPGTHPPSMSSSTRGPATPGLNVPGSFWQFTWASRPSLDVAWETVDFLQFACLPSVASCFTQEPFGAGVALLCTAYNPSTGISTWIDPSASHLDPGEVLTLNGV